MILKSWLTSIRRRLSFSAFPRRFRRRHLPSVASIVETFESRRLLSAAAVGLETQVNSYVAGNQKHPAVAMDASGSYAVTWESYAQEGAGGGYGIYAQRYAANGDRFGLPFHVNTVTNGDQTAPSIAMDAAGDFVIAFTSDNQDGSGQGIFAQRFSAAGFAVGSEFQVNTYTTQNQVGSSVAMDAAGDFVISWESKGQDGSGYGIYAQRYNSAGVAQGSEFRVNTYTTNDQSQAHVAMDQTGDFVVTWMSYLEDGSSYGIFAELYSANGTEKVSEFRANTFTTGGQTSPTVAMDNAGDFVIAWNAFAQDGSAYGVYGQRFNSSGVIQGSEFRINTTTTDNQIFPSASMDAAGDFVVTWESNLQDGSQFGVYGQQFHANGQMDGSEFRVNTFTTSNQFSPMVAMDAAGDFVAAWQSGGNQDGSGDGIFSQRYIATVGPIVTGVFDGPVEIHNGDRETAPISQLVVDFSTDMLVAGGSTGPSSILNPANWRLSWNAVPEPDAITGIAFNYNSATNRYEATLSLATPLDDGVYSIVAMPTLMSTSLQILDGDQDGVPGGNFQRNFFVARTVALGPETQVNTYTTGSQIAPVVASDAFGNYVVAWDSNGQDGSGDGIYAQLYNKAGQPQGSEFRVNSYTTGNQFGPAIAMDPTGDFVIAWTSDGQDGSGRGVYAQMYYPNGFTKGSEFRVNDFTTGIQTFASVAMDTQGDFVVTWSSYDQAAPGSGYDVYAKQYNSEGISFNGEFLVNTYTTGGQRFSSVAMDAAGDFAITWVSIGQDGSGDGIYAQRFDSGGHPLQTEFRVNTYTTGTQEFPAIAMDKRGDFVITWSSYAQFAPGSGYDIYAQRYNFEGFPRGPESLVNTYTTGQQMVSTVAMDAVGDYTIAWESANQDGSSYGVYARQFSSGGIPVSTNDFRVNTTTVNAQGNANIAMDSAGDFVVTWQSYLQDGSQSGVESQRYETDVSPLIYGIELSTITAAAPLSTPITSSLAVYDADNDTWSGAIVQIASNYVSGQDVLTFTNQLGITGVWNAASGTLTLSGTSSVSNYRTALRNVLYHNTSASPALHFDRTITFQAFDGVLYGNVVSRQVYVSSLSIPAGLSGVSGTATYTESTAPIALGANLIITDPDTFYLASATVSFANWQGEDRTDFNNIFALQHTFVEDLVAHTATFTITGIDTLDHYQTLLRSVIYWDVTQNPVTTSRIANFTVSDGASTSNVVSRNIAVIAVNNPPLLSAIESTPLAYKANDPAYPPQQISSTLLVADPDSNNLSSATVQITGGYQNDANGKDILAFTNQLGITGSFNAANGMLTLTGISGVGNYRTALRSVTFSSSGSNVSTATRTLTLIGTDDSGTGTATGLPITRTVTVTTTNTPPALTGIPAAALAYVRGTAAVVVAPNLIVLDADSINLMGATIQVSFNYQNGQDVLGVTNGSGITGSFNAATGTLTLTGMASLAAYQSVLRTVTFKTNTGSASTATRTVTFIASDGLAVSSAVSRTVTLS